MLPFIHTIPASRYLAHRAQSKGDIALVQNWFRTEIFFYVFLFFGRIRREKNFKGLDGRGKKLIVQKQLQGIQTRTFENMKTLKCQKFQTWLLGGRMKGSRLPFMFNFTFAALGVCSVEDLVGSGRSLRSVGN